MKFTVNLPASAIEPPGEFQTAEAIREMAQAIESLGYDACWVDDHPMPDAAWLRDARGHDATEPFVALALAAAHTTRLRLHTNILVLPYRNPFLTAKSVAVLEVASGGRMILGVGSGYLEGEFAALGVDFRQRGKLTDEALEAMMQAWSGQDVVMQGMHFNAAGNLSRPFPPKAPTIWIGGAADKALERVVRHGSGWSPFFGPKDGGEFRKAQVAVESVEDLRARARQLDEMMQAAGRTDKADICINLPARIGTMDRAEADRAIEAVQACGDAGATWMFVGFPHPSRAAYLDHLQWFSEEVMCRART